MGPRAALNYMTDGIHTLITFRHGLLLSLAAHAHLTSTGAPAGTMPPRSTLLPTATPLLHHCPAFPRCIKHQTLSTCPPVGDHTEGPFIGDGSSYLETSMHSTDPAKFRPMNLDPPRTPHHVSGDVTPFRCNGRLPRRRPHFLRIRPFARSTGRRTPWPVAHTLSHRDAFNDTIIAPPGTPRHYTALLPYAPFRLPNYSRPAPPRPSHSTAPLCEQRRNAT